MKAVVFISCLFISNFALGQSDMWSDHWNWSGHGDTAKYKGVVMGYYINKTTMVDTNGKIIGHQIKGERMFRSSEHIDSQFDERSQWIIYYLTQREGERRERANRKYLRKHSDEN